MWLACSRKQLYEKDTMSIEEWKLDHKGHHNIAATLPHMMTCCSPPYLEVGRPEEPLKSKAANLPRHHKTIR